MNKQTLAAIFAAMTLFSSATVSARTEKEQARFSKKEKAAFFLVAVGCACAVGYVYHDKIQEILKIAKDTLIKPAQETCCSAFESVQNFDYKGAANEAGKNIASQYSKASDVVKAFARTTQKNVGQAFSNAGNKISAVIAK